MWAGSILCFLTHLSVLGIWIGHKDAHQDVLHTFLCVLYLFSNSSYNAYVATHSNPPTKSNEQYI